MYQHKIDFNKFSEVEKKTSNGHIIVCYGHIAEQCQYAAIWSSRRLVAAPFPRRNAAGDDRFSADHLLIMAIFVLFHLP